MMDREELEFTVNTIKEIEAEYHFLENNQLEEFLKIANRPAYCLDGDVPANFSLYTQFFLSQDVDVLHYLTEIPDNCFSHILDEPKLQGTLIIPNNITAIGSSAFRQTEIEEVYIPASVQYIQSLAFRQCSNLHHVTIKGNPKIYQDDAFGTIFSTNRQIEFHCPNKDFYDKFVNAVENKASLIMAKNNWRILP